jgi:glucoamylase
MPIMLGWKLWKLGWLPEADLKAYYGKMIKPAADFLVEGRQGRPRLEPRDHHPAVHPAGALGRAGRLFALDHRRRDRRPGGGRRHRRGRRRQGIGGAIRKTADAYSAKVEARMVTTKGRSATGPTMCA